MITTNFASLSTTTRRLAPTTETAPTAGKTDRATLVSSICKVLFDLRILHTLYVPDPEISKILQTRPQPLLVMRNGF